MVSELYSERRYVYFFNFSFLFVYLSYIPQIIYTLLHILSCIYIASRGTFCHP